MNDEEMDEFRARLQEGLRSKVEEYDWDKAFTKHLEGL